MTTDRADSARGVLAEVARLAFPLVLASVSTTIMPARLFAVTLFA